MLIQRLLEDQISAVIGSHKAIIIMGARQVGKSTLLHTILDDKENVMWMNGDDIDIQHLFSDMSSTRVKAILGKSKILVIDEAQRIADIGLRLKLITDQMKNVQVIATGSSSFSLANKVNESLTGRKREFKLFPISFKEMVNHSNLLDEIRLLPHRMLYGYYPEVVCSAGQEKTILKELSVSYLYRDILSMEGINKPDKLTTLLQALAYQIGSQISYNEIGRLVGLDSKTIERYIDVLEKSSVVFRLGSFSRNLRNELKRSRKIYFWDLGIRNAIIGNFSQIENRQDVGALWENFCVAERMKLLVYNESFARSWFWRTQQQQEIDYVEEEDGKISAFEFKWSERKKNVRFPSTFATAYPAATFTVITPDNIEEFLL